MLVGFFLAGLVIHGGVQAWWIATILTAFNDNAAITFLATLVPDFSDSLKHAVVAGAGAGGGLTIIANAPNPAGISLLKKYFDHGVSPAGLFAAALAPTVFMFVIFLVTFRKKTPVPFARSRRNRLSSQPQPSYNLGR